MKFIAASLYEGMTCFVSEDNMGRTPKPDFQAAALSGYPTPAPADYSDEVTVADFEALNKLVCDSEGDEWDLVDGPAW